MLGSGLAFALAGTVILATLPLPIGASAAAAVLWLSGSLTNAERLRRRYRGIRGYRLYADGSVDIVRADGRRVVGRLAPGTFLLPRLAWLRVTPPEGGPVAELVAGDPRTSQHWRRFQVICRHVSAC